MNEHFEALAVVCANASTIAPTWYPGIGWA
jgi:hypothetical protein